MDPITVARNRALLPDAVPILRVMAQPLRILITGTDTGVGKTHVTRLLARALRLLDRRVWLHKLAAAGVEADGRWTDVEQLAALCGDGQDPQSICPIRLREACSPHLAARLEGRTIALHELLDNLRALHGEHDLLVEGVGGLLVPLTPELETVLDVALAADLRALVVTRPHLGTLNHTMLTVARLRQAGCEPLGLVLNHHEPVADSAATSTAAEELQALTGLPLLATVGHATRPSEAELRRFALKSLDRWRGPGSMSPCT